MANPWETPFPGQSAPIEAPKPWETQPPSPEPDPRMAQNLVQNAPGAANASTPFDAFMAGLHSSASGLVASGGKQPDMQVPKNASFGMKLFNTLGQGLGDLPFNIVGAVGGAAAGSELGPGAAVTGGAGGMALPQAVRETMVDYYNMKQSGGSMTWQDMAHMIAHSAWNTGKAAVEGAVGGKAGGVLGDTASSLAGDFANPAFARTMGNVAGFTAAATGSQSVLDGQAPDAKDFAAGAIVSLTLGAAGHYAPDGTPKLSDAGEKVSDNMKEVYRQTGVPPWEQAAGAQRDAKLNDEIIGQDVNGDPTATKFNAQRPPEHEPYKTFTTNPAKIAGEHESEMAGIFGEAQVQQHVEELLPLIRTLEGSGDHAISPKGAIGRHQIMPGTARQYGFDPSRLTDPAYNEQVARTVLADLSRRFHGDTEAVLVAYNAGPGRAFQFLRDGRDTSKLPTETQKYLMRGGFGGKGGKPPVPPESGPEPEQPEANAGGPQGPDYSKITDENLVSRFQDAVGEEPETKASWFGDPMRQFVSELESARGIDKTMQRMGLLDPSKDISTEDMFRQTYASDDRANYMVTKGNIDPITFDAKEGPSLIDVVKQIKDVGGNMGEFDAYRVAKRTVDLANNRGVDTGIFKGGLPEAAEVVRRFGPKYEKINAAMQDWKLGGLEYGRDSGLWDQGRLNAMVEASSHVSLRRVMGDDKSFVAGQGGPGKFRATNPLKEMEGSDRQIVKPLTADVDNLRQIIRMADRNRAIGHVLGGQEALKGTVADLGLLRLPNPVVKGMIADPGSDIFRPYNVEPKMEEAMAPFAIEGKLGPNQFVYYRDGHPEVWSAKDPDVAKLFRGADSPGEADLLTKLLTIPAKLERAGILAAPDFALRVPMKHQLTAWALDPLHPAPYLTAIRGAMDVMGKGDAYWDLMRRGGLSGAITEMDMAKATDAAVGDQDTLMKTGALDRTWNAVSHPLHLAQMITEKLTQMERVGYFKRAVAKGLDPNKAAMMGRKAYLDFSERSTGNLANWMAKTIPFFRATMLGLRQGRDAIVDRPVQTMFYASALASFQVGMYVLNKQADKGLEEKDRYTSLPQWERDQFFITPPVDGVRMRLARPYVIGPMIGTPVERFLESEYEKDPHAFDQWFSSTFTDVAPSNMPAAVRPIMEQVTNHNFFTGMPLVSDSLKGATADQQYQENTSQLAKNISQEIGTHRGLGIADVSPIVIDNYVREWTGSVGTAVLHLLNAPLGKEDTDSDWKDMDFVRGFVIQNPRMNTKQISDFYRDAEKWEALHQDVYLEKKRGDINSAVQDQTEIGQRASTIVAVEHALNVQRTTLQHLADRKDLNTDEKRQLSDRVYQDAWQIARFGSRILAGDNPSNEEAQALSDQVQSDTGAANGTE